MTQPSNKENKNKETSNKKNKNKESRNKESNKSIKNIDCKDIKKKYYIRRVSLSNITRAKHNRLRAIRALKDQIQIQQKRANKNCFWC